MVMDFSPLSKATESIDRVKEAIPRDVPLIQVCMGPVTPIVYFQTEFLDLNPGGRPQHRSRMGHFNGTEQW